jgi:hypothetical protein
MHTPGVLQEISIAVDTISEARRGVDSEGAASAEIHSFKLSAFIIFLFFGFGIFPANPKTNLFNYLLFKIFDLRLSTKK